MSSSSIFVRRSSFVSARQKISICTGFSSSGSDRKQRAPLFFALLGSGPLGYYLNNIMLQQVTLLIQEDFCKGSCVEIGNITYRRRTILLYIWKIRGGLTPWKGLYEQIGMTDWLIFRFLVLLSLKSFFLFLPCPCTGV
ncbi:uncharacterized protein LOC130721365 isoform X3 [Lotus japonicus]|uniref:uncharacterized protein LOC130721365 isoform X3 n=1 Tax=Lotus japonicus TaxID=34305 RepID=UPI00258D5674|nr:uncharacterized protein LOC130721365 isoform X3 [Lotus japonicus]